MTRVIETTARIEDKQKLIVDTPLPALQSQSVRVMIFFPDEEDMNESDWLRSISHNPAFDFLHDPGEDVYSLTDGKPFDAER